MMAYEMRISDWSSDVCSSDLLRSRRLEGRLPAPSYSRRLKPRVVAQHLEQQVVLPLAVDAQVLAGVALLAEADLQQQAAAGVEHGRDACRERGCQKG